MFYTSSANPKSDHAADLERGSEALRRAAFKLRTEVNAVEVKVDSVIWTGRFADDVRSDFKAVRDDLRIRERQMRIVAFNLGTHAAWLREEQVRLREVETLVRRELKRRGEAGEVVRVLPDEIGWVWDEIAAAEGVNVPRPESNKVLFGRSMRPRG